MDNVQFRVAAGLFDRLLKGVKHDMAVRTAGPKGTGLDISWRSAISRDGLNRQAAALLIFDHLIKPTV